MIQVNYPYIRRVKKRLADGSVKYYYYHKYTGQKIDGDPGSLEFQMSYDIACRKRVKETNTFAVIIQDYFLSRDFIDLSERTKRDYIRHKNFIEEKWASVPLEVVKDKRITKDFRK